MVKKKITKTIKKNSKRAILTFENAFRYPFSRAKGLLNILWFFLPIIGWFALGGYKIRIVQNFIKGEYNGLPVFKFGDHFKLGFFMFFKSIPFMIVYGIVTTIVLLIPFIGIVGHFFISLFVIPLLFINFFNKETVGSLFEFSIVKHVFDNFEDYIIALLKSIGLGLIFFLMMIILVGIPAGSFTKNIFLADFYGRRVK
ncbi:DUF4013 domain-containing protein [Candidatus Woesearchaeota archaeon]|jgi:hypothetical protein|nr:DUF4013 domain-containing protein [Candidatus Woesearchaeota archaeon]MBT5342770.1 DUF4013 domain-containing protein [Candidatus Woesearchaeota archaeon]